MSSDTQSPHSSPVKYSVHSVRVHLLPSLVVVYGSTASGMLLKSNKSRTRSVTAILRGASSLLDRNTCIIAPFDDEVWRDAEFYQS